MKTTEVVLIRNPTTITVTLLDDGVTGEGLEDIILTLVQDIRTPSNHNEFLVFDTVHIFLLDNDSMNIFLA